ncbi:MAG TPA: fumarylacetoacetate hydrolase family protein [Conexibacter sp.]|jgi:fumarylacetoacetase
MGARGESWVAGAAGPWGLDHLPYGVVAVPGRPPLPSVRIGDFALPLASLACLGTVALDGWATAPDLSALMAAGPATWSAVRAALIDALAIDSPARAALEPELIDLGEAALRLPFAIADYVGFYSSLEHATNLGRIFRPGAPPLGENWRHLPIGYHGRAGTVVVSGTPVRRPRGQRPTFGPTLELDYELEVGFVVGTPSEHGVPLEIADAEAHLFGAVLLNDWSARDLQRWEYRPLGPFLGKSFATSISAWVTPMAALVNARVDGPVQDPAPLPYLAQSEPRGFALDLRIELQSAAMARAGLDPVLVAQTSLTSLYWSPAQQLAHLTVNGASLRTGDLHATGTISQAGEDRVGSLIERTWAGKRPLELPDGTARSFLEDGDTVTLSAISPDGSIALGAVSGTVVAA